jgi:uroporphyrinogen-III synthase
MPLQNSKLKTHNSLKGRRIVVTRASEQAPELVERLTELGAVVVQCPAITIAPLQNYAALDEAIGRLAEYDWVIFTSANGVAALVERMSTLGIDLGELRSRRIAAIGPATTAALEKSGCEPDFVPHVYVAEAIVEQIGTVDGCRVLLPRADIAREALAEGLRAGGAHVAEVSAYRTLPGSGAATLVRLLREAPVDAVTFTSSSTVRYTIEGMIEAGLAREEASSLLNHTSVVCIGPITEATARGLGLNVAAVAAEYTTAGLVEALLHLFA